MPTDDPDIRDKSSRGNASQFFIAGELCRRGYSAVITLGNTPNVGGNNGVRAYYRHSLVRIRTTDNGPTDSEVRRTGIRTAERKRKGQKGNGSCLYSCRACGPVQ